MKINDTKISSVDFYFARSGNSLRAAIALELADVSFQKHELDLSQNEHKSAAFLKINPAGHVPTLVLNTSKGQITLAQSGAIMEYLLNKYRLDLIPKDEIARATCNAVVITALSDIAIQNALARYLSDHDYASCFIYNRMLANLKALFDSVKTAPFLCGNSITIADYAHFPVIYMRAHQLRDLPEFSHVLNWLERMNRDSAVTRAKLYAGVQIKS